MIKSIRWRLPLSYAAIALLVALSLGVILLIILRGYYVERERDYLASNAQAISVAVTRLLEAEQPPNVLQSQLDIFAFLTQVQVHVLDVDRQLVAASTAPETLEILSAAVPVSDPVWLEGSMAMPPDYQGMITVQGIDAPQEFTILEGVPSSSIPNRTVASNQFATVAFAEMPAVGTPFGFGLGADAVIDGPRSTQVVVQPFHDSANRLSGYVALSDGPAYGREIVNNVARGWALASVVAVALAAAVGWLVSRRMSAPLLALTDVTASMAAGDLAARANVASEDEFGTLAHSFNRMADRVEDTVVTLRRFVSDAAHEIHTPLTALRTNLELAAPDKYVLQAQAQVEELEALTQGLLDLSRLESGVQERANDMLIDLVPLVQEASERYASQAEQAGLTFDLVLPALPLIVHGDGALLHRALGNLLDNAIKFTPRGGCVRLGLRHVDAVAELSVEDTGIGILKEDLPYLFQRFHRGRNTTAYPGSGLGLAIAKAITERHDGHVQAEETEQGARFTLRIPLA